jgi:cbb3-type cytochrome oxidase subunit 3
MEYFQGARFEIVLFSLFLLLLLTVIFYFERDKRSERKEAEKEKEREGDLLRSKLDSAQEYLLSKGPQNNNGG